jgi:HAD superfamily hydrolase (TIGR01509 family)
MIRAIIFDFDGLILETEEPTYQSWQEVYQSFGYSLPFSAWATMVGTTQSDFDPLLELQKLVKDSMDWDAVEYQRLISENTLIETQSILPGVQDYLSDAQRLGLKIGLASTSSSQWVMKHLTRLGLVNYFDCIRTSDDVQHIKPDPELYLSVLRGLEVKADEAFALEDSPPGIASAEAAGLVCIAVPNVLTSRLVLTQADFQLHSLAEMPLEELLQKVAAIKTQRAAF